MSVEMLVINFIPLHQILVFPRANFKKIYFSEPYYFNFNFNFNLTNNMATSRLAIKLMATKLLFPVTREWSECKIDFSEERYMNCSCGLTTKKALSLTMTVVRLVTSVTNMLQMQG